MILLISICGCFNNKAEKNEETKDTNSLKEDVTKSKDLIVQIIDKTMFDKEVLEYSEPVIVKFTAPWCGACQMMNPIYHKLAKEFEGKVKFTEVNVDNVSQIAQKYQVQGIPTFIFYKDGDKKGHMIGASQEAGFKDLINKYFSF